MGKFDRFLNTDFKTRPSFRNIHFAKDTSILEVELNEMQMIQREYLRDVLRAHMGDGIYEVGTFEVWNDPEPDPYVCQPPRLQMLNEVAVVNGELIHVEELRINVSAGDTIYLEIWDKDVTWQNVLYKDGNEYLKRQIPNMIKDSRTKGETSRRTVVSFKLTKTKDDIPGHYYLELGTIKSSGEPQLGCYEQLELERKVKRIGSKGGGSSLSMATIIITKEKESRLYQQGDYIVKEGALDSQVVINEAIQALGPTGGRICLKEGLYIVNGNIILPSNVSLEGVGPATIIRTMDNAPNQTWNVQNADFVNGNTNITLANLVLDGNYKKQVLGYNNTCTQFHRVDNLTIINVEVRGAVSEGIYAYHCSHGIIDSSRFVYNNENQLDASGIQLDECDHFVVSDSYFGFNGFHGLLCNNVTYSTITNCVFEGNGYDGMKLQGVFNNTFVGNVCVGNRQRGVFLKDWSENNVFSGNQFIDNGFHGLIFYQSSNNIAVGNNCSNNGIVGLGLSEAYECKLANNDVRGNKYQGISVELSEDCQITGNSLGRNGKAENEVYAQIVVAQSNLNSITNNFARMGNEPNKPTYGLFIDGDSSDNFVFGNDLRKGGVSGGMLDFGTNTITTMQNLT